MVRVSRLALIALAACGPDGSTSPPTSPETAPRSIVITVAPPVFQCRNTQMVATVFDGDGRPLDPQPPISWSSSIPAIAKVSQTGVVSGLLAGPVDITVASGQVSATRPTIVYARAVSVWYVWVRPDPATLAVGDSLKLTAIADANDQLYEYPVTWESRSPGVATISPSGMVKAHGAGDATIEATFVEPADGNDLSLCPARTFRGTAAVKVR